VKRITREMVSRWNGRLRAESVPEAGWNVVELLRSDAAWEDVVGILAANDALENDAIAADLIRRWHARAEWIIASSERPADWPHSTLQHLLRDIEEAAESCDLLASFHPTSLVAAICGGDACVVCEWGQQRADMLGAVDLRRCTAIDPLRMFPPLDESACAATVQPSILGACKP